MSKVVKVTVTKTRNQDDTETVMGYPATYDPAEISPFIYQDEGLDTEYCLGVVEDSYVDSTGIEIVDNTTATGLINDWVDNNKDLTGLTTEEKQEIKDKKIACLPS